MISYSRTRSFLLSLNQFFLHGFFFFIFASLGRKRYGLYYKHKKDFEMPDLT